jgi:DNA-binding CsgD family transcriptional regulator
VIGLASVSTAEVESLNQVPEALYQFFAEEVFAALGDDVQTGLATLAVAPVIDRELAATLLGANADAIVLAALDVGIVVERGAQLELHPLARSFLEERRAQLRLTVPADAVGRCLGVYRRRREWDAALDIVAKNNLTTEIEPVLRDALDDLLDMARLSSIKQWLALARKARLDGPTVSLATAEAALRYGRCAEARTFAEAAALSGAPGIAFRALSLAGRATHLVSNEETALNLYKRAEAAASNDRERREALWGQLRCSIELELPSATETMRHLISTVNPSDAREIVHAASCSLLYQEKMGALDLTQAASAHELLDGVVDPLVLSGFQCAYSFSLGLTARYEEAQGLARELLATARRYRLSFAIPYALTSAAVAHAGLRQWSEAEDCCREAVSRGRAGNDINVEQFAYSVYVRILVQQGQHQRALSVHMPSLQRALASAHAEVQLSRALTLAVAGRLFEARALVREYKGVSGAVEPAVLSAAVAAICAVKDGQEDTTGAVARLAETAFSTGAVDLLVTAYRSTPALLVMLLRSAESRDRVAALVDSVHDADLADAIGCATRTTNPQDRLTAREREVFAFLRQGLTNSQIAKALFIEESTVKRHAHHIYDKLGVRSRTALAVQAALERDDQATSAIDVTGAGAGDS